MIAHVENFLLGLCVAQDAFRLMDVVGPKQMDRMAAAWWDAADQLGWEQAVYKTDVECVHAVIAFNTKRSEPGGCVVWLHDGACATRDGLPCSCSPVKLTQIEVKA